MTLKTFYNHFYFESTLVARPGQSHQDGGAVIRKPRSAWLEDTPTMSTVFMFCFLIVVLK